MILPLFVCQTCGKYAGLSLYFSQSMVKAVNGEKIDKDKPIEVQCPDGHGAMYEVKPTDRLHVLSDVMQVEKEQGEQ